MHFTCGYKIQHFVARRRAEIDKQRMVWSDAFRRRDKENQCPAIPGHHSAVVHRLESLPQIAVGGVRAGDDDVWPLCDLDGVDGARDLNASSMRFHYISRNHTRNRSTCIQRYVDNELEPRLNGDVLHLFPNFVVDVTEDLVNARTRD